MAAAVQPCTHTVPAKYPSQARIQVCIKAAPEEKAAVAFIEQRLDYDFILLLYLQPILKYIYIYTLKSVAKHISL